MPLSLEQFVKQLEGSGLVAGDILKDFLSPKASPKDAEELARELVRKKKLTKFQAEEIYKGKGKSLVLGNYVLMEKIGAGGMGQVFKARHSRMDRLVAVKLLPPATSKDKSVIARFEREVKAAAKITHPNIVAALDADCANGIHFLVMELVEGSDLSDLVKKNGPFSIEKTLNYILQAAKGLEAAHRKGIIHRDIKPANLLLDKEGTVKVLDMGLARLSLDGDESHSADLTSTGAVMGTIDYMPPEQALDTKTADARADIYALGCSLFYLLTGTPTYQGDTVMKKLLAHREQPIPSLRTVRAEVPEPLEAVFKTMVAKKTEDRYQTMTEVIAALEGCSHGNSNTLHLPSSTSGAVVKPNDSSNIKSIESSTEMNTSNFFDNLQSTPKQSSLAKNPLLKGETTRRNYQKKLLLIGVAALSVMVFLAGVVLTMTTPNGDGTSKLVPLEKEVIDSHSSSSERWNTPAHQQWIKDVETMPVETQVEAVSKRLKELNPGFDGTVTPYIQDGVVKTFHLMTDDVTDISPLRVFPKLQAFVGNGSESGKGQLADLSPLKGMSLSSVNCCFTKVADLSPLKQMRLDYLQCVGTKISDLSPLKGMPLTKLHVGMTNISNLSPLKGMNLSELNIGGTQVSDLSTLQGMPLTNLAICDVRVIDLRPLTGMPLEFLTCLGTQVSDLSPLKGMPLTNLDLRMTQVTSLLPLKDMPLKEIYLDLKPDANTELLRSIKTLETINGKPAAEFWREIDEQQKMQQLGFQSP